MMIESVSLDGFLTQQQSAVNAYTRSKYQCADSAGTCLVDISLTTENDYFCSTPTYWNSSLLLCATHVFFSGKSTNKATLAIGVVYSSTT